MLRDMTRDMSGAARDNKLRDWANRRGYTLVKSARQDALALDYGRYVLIPGAWDRTEPRGGGPEVRRAFSQGLGLTADEMAVALRLPPGEFEQLAAIVKSTRKSAQRGQS